MLPTLLGRPKQQIKHEYLYWEFHEQGKKQAVRLGKYKGIRLNVAKNPDGPIELYDLQADVGEQHNIAEELGRAVLPIANNLDVRTVLVFTMAGYTARMVSKYRPPVRIIASTPNQRVYRQLKLLWGTETILVKHHEDLDALLLSTIKELHQTKVITADERIIVVRASSLVPGKTNIIEVFTVKEVLQAKLLQTR